MNLELIEDNTIKARLEELMQHDYILGFLLQGSRVTGFGNSKSDYDIIIYCTNEHFQSLNYDSMLESMFVEENEIKRLVGDFAYFCDDIFEQQKTSPMDIDHVAYSESAILLDKTGKLQRWVDELSKIDDAEFETRLKMQMVQLAVAIGYANINENRERELDVIVNLQRFMTIAVSVWFTLKKSWKPQLKWWSSYVKKLGITSTTYDLFESCFRELTLDNTTKLYNHIKSLIAKEGIEIDFKKEFVSTLTTEGRQNYIRHSYF